jgi:hypothetical protein
MEYREIVAVTGLPGLFQLLSTKSDGAIVKSLADMSTRFISARMHNVTPLESIEVYTIAENVRLHHVFKKMVEHESTIPVIDPKADDKGIKNYFKTIFPEFDEVRVYVSDMKKMLKWYDLLKSNDLLVFKDEETAAEDEGAQNEAADANQEATAPATEALAEEEMPAPKPKKAKKAVVETEVEVTADEEKPKKTAKKKKTEE